MNFILKKKNFTCILVFLICFLFFAKKNELIPYTLPFPRDTLLPYTKKKTEAYRSPLKKEDFKNETQVSYVKQKTEEFTHQIKSHPHWEEFKALKKIILKSALEKERLQQLEGSGELWSLSLKNLTDESEQEWNVTSEQNRIESIDFIVHALEKAQDSDRNLMIDTLLNYLQKETFLQKESLLLKKSLMGDRIEIFKIVKFFSYNKALKLASLDKTAVLRKIYHQLFFIDKNKRE